MYPIFNKMDRFVTISDGHPGQVIATKHGINLAEPENMDLHCCPYRAGLRYCELESTETDIMLTESVIELCNSRCAPLIVLAKRKTDPYAFVATTKRELPLPSMIVTLICERESASQTWAKREFF